MRKQNDPADGPGSVASATGKPRHLLADAAFLRLEEWIGTNVLPAGAMVSEAHLGVQLGMGRTPVREALQRLRQIGLVEMHPRQGTLVTTTDAMRQMELLEIRRPLEAVVARGAAQRATTAERSLLKALADRLIDAAGQGDVSHYFHVNREIHVAEVIAAHNRSLMQVMAGIHAQSRRFWFRHFIEQNAFYEAAERHAAVLRAMAAGAADDAVGSAAELMALLERLTRVALDDFAARG